MFSKTRPNPPVARRTARALIGHGLSGPLVEDVDSSYFAIDQGEISQSREGLERNIRKRTRFFAQRAHNLAASRIAIRVKNAIAAVSAFASKQELGAFPIESGSPFDETLDGGRSFFDERSYCFDIAKAVAGHNCVVLVELYFIIIVEGGSDTALRILGGRLLQAVLSNDENSSGSC